MNGIITMNNTESYKFQIITKFLCTNISRKEASVLLRITERSVSRLARKVKNLGISGIKHGNSGNDYNKKYSDEFFFCLESFTRDRINEK